MDYHLHGMKIELRRNLRSRGEFKKWNWHEICLQLSERITTRQATLACIEGVNKNEVNEEDMYCISKVPEVCALAFGKK